ncbi:Type 1 glutamine amidotransferase-like domain-containing protein [Bacillus sp. NPDC077027]|uniref:Type 1 glutamine amidotransferase-like domain-containing protein n=1 Tax=Bacillus sp. NPDC077027 TaxID=3390548 RepID=UPI003D0302C2
MKKLFLCSSFSDSKYALQEFAGENLKGKRVTFIPTASVVEEVTHYVEAAKAVFHQLGMHIDILDIAKEPKERSIQTIKKNDLIYVSGGNTFYLLQELRKNKMDQVLSEEIQRGKLYIGESAGTIIMSPNIKYISLMDDEGKAPELASYQGLNEINSYPVPHVKNEYLGNDAQQIVNQYASELRLLPLTDQQVILVEGDKIAVK